MKSLFFTTALFLMYCSLFGQLKGSGKIIEKSFDYSGFDKINLEDIDGSISIEVGKKWSIKVSIDDNLFSLLAFEEEPSEGLLKIFLKGNQNNRMYIEDTNIKIQITMPDLTFIKHDGNSKLSVMNIKSLNLKIENFSNASTTLQGTVDDLIAVNTGNGNLYAYDLNVKLANITCKGNGNVKVNVGQIIVAKVSGNGNVVNKGKGGFEKSTRTGNGNLTQL